MPTARQETRSVIVGCGYVGTRLGLALARGQKVLGIVSSVPGIGRLRQAGLDGLAIDLDGPTGLFDWTGADLFYLVPPPPEGESDPRLARFLARLTGRPRTFLYMSTTGVYGHAAGAEVTEETPIRPLTPRARRRASAEEQVRTWCTEHGVRRLVLRVPGIYGPGRLPLERLAAGEPAVKVAEAGVGNRIHVDDLVTACIAAAAAENACGIYNVTDSKPLNATEFLLRVAALSGLPPPPQISMDEAQLLLSAGRLSFLNESRRVSNRRMLEELKVQLRYTDVDEGIRQSLAGDG